MNFFTDRLTEKAFAIGAAVQDWIDDNYEDSFPIVSVITSYPFLCIEVDGMSVWHSDVDDEDTLTFEYCLESLKKQVMALAEAFKE